MGRHVDGYLVPVPAGNITAYKSAARKVGKLFREYGALELVECVADDVKPGKLTSFPQGVRLEDGELVVFSWVAYRSRAHRDSVHKKVMADPRMVKVMSGAAMPFDGKRMIFGGFKTMLEL